MKYIQGQDRSQITLFPNCIEDYVEEDNPVRVIDAFVDSLDLAEAGFCRTTPNDTGRPPYHPQDLLKLYVYGYFNKIRSSRKLMIECTRNVELFYLLGKLTPDFRTIADFRKDNSKALKNVFHAFVKLCMKLGLYQKELFAVDGSKFRAVNSKGNTFNAEILEKKLKRIDDHIKEYLSQMDQEDQSQPDAPTSEQMKAAIKELNQRKETYQEYLKELLESRETQLLLTDPEARRMHSKDGFHCCYNVQTAVDKGSHLLADYQVTSHNTDQGLLNEVAQGVKESLGIETVEVVADKGYDSREDILNCIMNGIVPNVALKYDKHERLYTIEYEDIEITEDIRNSTKPEDIPINPFNHTLDRKDSPVKKVVLHIKEDIDKIKERMCLSEHPFGTVKWYHGAHYLLCKGKEKATTELGLSFLVYNMKRAINMVGIKELIAAM